jgi:DNA mismatch repair protein MutL
VYIGNKMSIKVLDSKVISQIAAGEVVERPASVVKELVENALDAGANQISVEIRGAGTRLIRVTDNGTGIADSEAELAFERHATSKIGNIDDLQQFTTLGFRGEALPSIASVAQVQFLTCLKGETRGTNLSLEEGKVVQHEFQARSQGTTVTVQNLFHKIPARLKFLKSESSESGHIAEIVSRYSLAYPEVKFTFINESKVMLRTPGNASLMDSVIAVYGLEIARNMLEVNNQTETWNGKKPDILVFGLAGAPGIARSSRDYLSFFVNRRWVNNRMLSFAVEEAYHGLLMQGKHPISILNINISPRLIDVNVHPSKTEIKFQDEHSVFGAVQKAVRQALVQSTPVPQVEEIKSSFSVPSTPFSIPQGPAIPENKSGIPSKAGISPTPLISLPLLRVLGQLARNYIVAEGPDGLFLIDQHAAHERIQLEKIRTQRANQKIDVQGLLEPVTLEVEPRQAAVLNAHLKDLADFGFNIETFGDKTFLLRAIPVILKDKNWNSLLQESLDTLSNNWSESFANTLACHSAIRAGQILSEAEMRELIHQLEQTTLPNSCPHGRPTMIQLTIHQIEKEFGRI